MMRILTITSLYPNAVNPNHGIFIENRLRYLRDSGEIELTVLAPVPWFPFSGGLFGRYADFARVPKVEERHGIVVHHPRFLTIPKIGMSIAPVLMYFALRKKVRELLETGARFDVIDAHYFYPDGVAATMIAREFHLPISVTARGSDLNLLPNYFGPRRWIRWAAEHIDAVVTVSAALAARFQDICGDKPKTIVLRNGVNLDQFKPLNRVSSRQKLNLPIDSQIILSVGNLLQAKGHHLLIEALPDLPDAILVIVGSGLDRSFLVRVAAEQKVTERVMLLGAVPHADMAAVYSAGDILGLMSEREGWPNVLLEAMACGTPVIVTKVGGVPEIVTSEAAGVLADSNKTEILAGLERLLADPPARKATRKHAEGFSWERTTKGQLGLFQDLLREKK